jgi:hypothetical protein
MDVTDLGDGINDLIAAIPDYKQAGKYYDGTVDEYFTSARLRRLFRSVDKMRLNFAKTPVDVVANKLEIRQLVASSPNGAQEVLDKIAKMNDLDIELPMLLLRTLKYGDSYLMLDGDQADGISLYYNSPLQVRAMYSDENPRKIAYTIKRWRPRSLHGRVRVNLWYPDHIDRFITKDDDCNGTDASEFIPFTGTNGDEDAEIDNEYGFIPSYHFRTDRPYGRPEHKDAYGPQDALNKLAITMLSTMDFHSAPQRWALMNDHEGTEDVDDFDEDWMHDDDAPDGNGKGPMARHGQPADAKSSLTSDAGGVWLLKNIKSVGQFNVADSDVFIKPSEYIIRAMAQTTTTPLHYFDPTGDMPSGESLKVADAPLNNKARARGNSFAATLKDALGDALSVMGVDNAEVSILWAPIESIQGSDDWAMAGTKLKNGVPTRQVLNEMGYTNEQLDDWGVPDSQYAAAGSATFEQQSDSLLKIGQALQALANVEALDVISSEQLNGIVEQFVRKEQGDE